MGSSPTVSGGGGNGNTCCGMSLKSWCRWRWDPNFFISSTFIFFVGFLVLYVLIGGFYARMTFAPYPRSSLPSIGCHEDSEGSWSIGVFYGDSPFSLKPIETTDVWRDESGAWPVANPVVTCSSVSDAGFPSNFVADPFLFIQDDTFYLFYETKNSIKLQGDIGVAKSVDNGATWQHLGIALDEDWHLSFPYVFKYHDRIYMMPESSQKGELRIYRALNFPLQWTLEKVVIKKPLIDSFLINYNGKYWIFGSDHTGFRTQKNGQLEIWYSTSPLGPYKPHKKNPIYNTNKSFGARNAGRPFIYNGSLYRLGQDCGKTYGARVHAFKIDTLTLHEFSEIEVPLGFENPRKGRNNWNGARHHHLDVQQLTSGKWVGFMDGDRAPSGDSIRYFVLGCASAVAVLFIVGLLGVFLGAVKLIVPLNWCAYSPGKRSDRVLAWERSDLSSKIRRFCSRLNRAVSFLQCRVNTNKCAGKLVFFIVFILGVGLTCYGVKCIFGGSGAEEPYPLMGQNSQFTLLTMTYDARLWNLKMYVRHYSRCASVREIVVVWNKGTPPNPNDLESAVPIRFRLETRNSLNNRFRVDPSIKTRAVLELDDDIMMTCDDVERGFRVWREHPDRIVGFYPRLIRGNPLKYRGEKYARAHGGYNMILTGAAFVDGSKAFERYWGEDARMGREIVDEFFNCEDVLLNFLYANSSSGKNVEYVKPAWAIDTSKFSGVAISRDTNAHYCVRSKCLMKFSEMYGELSSRVWEFDARKDGWDV